MESTWETRDLLVLDAIVRYFDEQDAPHMVNLATIAKITGMDPGQVARAMRALSPRYIETSAGLAGLTDLAVKDITDEARQAVGQWPTPPESMADRIVAALLEAADREPDQRKRTKLRAAAETLGGFARDLLVNATANVATKPIEF